MTAPRTIIFVRHGEKPRDGGAPHGVNSHGEHDGHSLSVRGWTRAGALAAMFAHAPHATHPGLVAPTKIYATRPTHSAKSTREVDTAMPTARRLGLDVDDSIAHGDEHALVKHVLGHTDDTLVVWHHGRLADVVRSFPVANPDDVPDGWPDHRYDLYWILTSDPKSNQYVFSVLPQQLLDGDESA